MNKVERDIANLPDTTVSVKDTFGFESKMVVPAYSVATEHVPDIDPDYLFDQHTTMAILAGFAFAFIFSFDEVVVAQFLSGPQMETLPRRMWEGIQMGGLDKTITAVTTVQLILAVVAILSITTRQWRPTARPPPAPDQADRP